MSQVYSLRMQEIIRDTAKEMGIPCGKVFMSS